MITMNEYDYDALLSYATTGANTLGEAAALAVLKKKIDNFNNVERFAVLVAFASLPVKASVTSTTGILLSADTLTIELRRPVTKDDVLERIRDRAHAPQQIFVTRDLAGEVGWYELEAFPF